MSITSIITCIRNYFNIYPATYTDMPVSNILTPQQAAPHSLNDATGQPANAVKGLPYQIVFTNGEPVLITSKHANPSLVLCSTHYDELNEIIFNFSAQALTNNRRLHIIPSTYDNLYQASDNYNPNVLRLANSIQESIEVIEDYAQRILFYSSSNNRISQESVLIIHNMEHLLASSTQDDREKVVAALKIIADNGHRFNMSVIIGFSPHQTVPNNLKDIINKLHGSIIHINDEGYIIQNLPA